MSFVLTDKHSDRAYLMGQNHARAEISLGNEKPQNCPLDDEDIRQLAWEITTVKMEPDSDEAVYLAACYEDGYFEGWENHA